MCVYNVHHLRSANFCFLNKSVKHLCSISIYIVLYLMTVRTLINDMFHS